MEGSIASAVAFPEPQESPPASPTMGHKRRQSSLSEQDGKDGKRPRYSNDSHDGARRASNAGNTASEGAPERRRSSAVLNDKERTRGRRLFGAVLGSLGSASATTAQKRRAEIEKKQQAKLKLQAEENDQRKKERLAQLNAQRQQEQLTFEEESLQIRHASLLNMAHFLQTRSEPRLYYKPWELTEEEEDRIKDQVADAHSIIKRERDEFEARRAEEEGRERDASREMDLDQGPDALQPPNIGGGKVHIHDAAKPQERSIRNGDANDRSLPKNPGLREDQPDSMSEEAVNGECATNDQTQTDFASQAAAAEEGGKEALDENGEEVVETAEDTVIY